MGYRCMCSLHGCGGSRHPTAMVTNHSSDESDLEADHRIQPLSRPLHFAWDKAFPGSQGYCIDEDKFFRGSGSVNVVLNFVVFVLVSHGHLNSAFDSD